MMQHNLNIVSFGDVHLGHHRTKCTNTISGLDAIFEENDGDSIDLITINGDLFDRLLYYPDDDIDDIEAWVLRFLTKCSECNIIVRVLEGTPSHDMRQSACFIRCANLYNIDVDVKHIVDLRVEIIDALNLSILYVPDEWSTDSSETYREAVAKIKSAGLDIVDIIIMHGQFEYQLPGITLHSSHNSELWLKLVRYVIYIGHIHQHSIYDKIVACGSLDRHTHNDEGDKGYVKTTITNGVVSHEFKVNKIAKIYHTVDIDNISNIDEILLKINTSIRNNPSDSYIRISGNKDQPLDTIAAQIKNDNPDYNIGYHYKKKKDLRSTNISAMSKISHDIVNINDTNIGTLVANKLKERCTAIEVDASLSFLNELREAA